MQNVGRRRYPTYWFSGSKVFVKSPDEKSKEETLDHMEMDIEEGITTNGFMNTNQLDAASSAPREAKTA